MILFDSELDFYFEIKYQIKKFDSKCQRINIPTRNFRGKTFELNFTMISFENSMAWISYVRLPVSTIMISTLLSDSGPTNGQNKRMAKFEVNGQIFKFSETANGHGHSPNRQNSNRRMASQNFIFSLPQCLLRTDPDPFWT